MTYAAAVLDAHRDVFASYIADLRAQQQRIATLLAGIGPLLGFVSTIVPSTSQGARTLSIMVICLLAAAMGLCGIGILPFRVASMQLKPLSHYDGRDEDAARAEMVADLQSVIADSRTAGLKKTRNRLFVAALGLTTVALGLLVVLAFQLPQPAHIPATSE